MKFNFKQVWFCLYMNKLFFCFIPTFITVLNIFYFICVLQLCRTVKIQVGDLLSGTMEFQLNFNSRTSDLLTQFHRQFVRSPENGKGKMRRCAIMFRRSATENLVRFPKKMFDPDL